ncbi:hypothetical protein SAMN04488038_104187 [Solimonas aquatica]|jgi:hypothetical protein|uniref:Uncharacterized protein n=1 Tax=Solimonas aquatica TaxID=489703 RepID=A0A1H9DWB6_9GAMM|nr:MULTISPECIES: hypothetical protein [Solimonas]SEQ17682.1 hypothetical protein SAMN04488038_104187 [Solimonas aquatica]
MSSFRLSRAFAGTLLLVSSALSFQAQARPSDPLWHPLASVPASSEKTCGPIVKPAWFGPRGGGVVVGNEGACPKPSHVIDHWVGPRGNVPVYR